MKSFISLTSKMAIKNCLKRGIVCCFLMVPTINFFQKHGVNFGDPTVPTFYSFPEIYSSVFSINFFKNFFMKENLRINYCIFVIQIKMCLSVIIIILFLGVSSLPLCKVRHMEDWTTLSHCAGIPGVPLNYMSLARARVL